VNQVTDAISTCNNLPRGYFGYFTNLKERTNNQMKVKLKDLRLGMVLAGMCAIAIMFCFAPLEATAQSKEAAGASGQNLGAVGAKLANPLSELWSLTMNFQMPQFFDGDVNTGDSRVGASMIFQPVMPIPLYGEGAGEWRMITRPVIPLIFSQPVPRGYDDFYNKGGIGDIQLPLLLSVPDKYAGKFILGAGPIGMFPSATTDALGSDQWAVGPAVVFGYKTKKWTAVLFPNYFWQVGSSGQDSNTPNINQGSLLYSFTYKLPDAWQVGTNPTISYNHQATSGNKWNVPVGLFVGKTVKIGKLPVNIKAGVEYSVVSPDDFGQRAQFRFQITPVVPGLIKNPIFGK
jgi:hypothetical protein